MKKLQKNDGKVVLYTGSMKSSKSAMLYDQIDRAQYRKKKVCLIRPNKDTRKFVCRKFNTEVDILRCDSISELYDSEDIDKYDIICIDEGQFIDDIGIESNQLAKEGKEVYIAALNGDSDLKPWKNVSELLPYCDDIIRLNAVCDECGSSNTATFTYFNGKKDNQIVIGDGEYYALCRRCWHNKTYGK